jgi:hypothetical protein
VALSLLAAVALLVATSFVYSIHETYGGFGFGADLAAAVVAGGVIGLAVWAVTHGVSRRRRALAITLSIALGATLVAGSAWLGDTSKQQQAQAQRTACDPPVADELLAVVDTAGRRVPQNGQDAFGRSDGSGSTMVAVRDGRDAALARAMLYAGWTRQDADLWSTPSGLEVSITVDWDDPGDEAVYDVRGRLP